MRRAFIFDMDGVLVDSEHAWQPYELPLLQELLGEEIASKLDLVGNSIRTVYEGAQALGSSVTEDEVAKAYNKAAEFVYANIIVADGVNDLGEKLLSSGLILGLVTQSPQSWIDKVLPKISFAKDLSIVLSIRENPALRPKPAPDGYLSAMSGLNVEAKNTIVLEDSNSGIKAAKDAGAFVIGYSGLLPKGYEQSGADSYAQTMEDVGKIVEATIQR